MTYAKKEKQFSYLRYQVNEIRKGGLFVFFRKLKLFLISLLLLPMIFIVRLIRHFVFIRFGSLRSERIGHYAADTELYLCERDTGLQPRRTFDIFFNEPVICNHQLKKMWDRTLFIRGFALQLYRANRLLLGYKKHIIDLPSYRDIHGLLERIPVHLSFTPEEEGKGCEALTKMGIPANAKFVCFHARDSAYLDGKFPADDFYYHNYRDSNIDNFSHAVEEFARRGYYLLRMGAVVKKNIQFESQNIIDYAKKFRTDFLDIFLNAKCYFYLGDSCGIDQIQVIFRRPVATANMIPLELAASWGPNRLFIPKKLWLEKESRFMTFREILESGVGRFIRTEKYEQAGINVVENTPEEIRDVAVEMDERLKGSWQTTEEDEELQQRFWALFKKSELHGVIRARIGRDFLRQNKDLLE